MKTLIIAAALALPMAAAWAGPEDNFNKAGCNACHQKAAKAIGPALKDVAAKYKGQDVAATLFAKVRSGGKGNWGQIPMAPNPPEKIGDGDLKEVIAWILAQ